MENQTSKEEKFQRMTNQRFIILDYLKKVKIHPTAETIYKKIRKKLPRISFGTVYRNLRLLKEKGEIQELDFGAEASHFDGNPQKHIHFHCQNCGQILDMFPEKAEKCFICLEKFSPGKIKDYRMEVYGICQDCQKMKEVISKKMRK